MFYPGAVGTSGSQIVDDGSGATIWQDDQGVLSGAVYLAPTDLRWVLQEGRSFTVTGSGGPDIGIYGYALELP